jgi:hypothetical protein
MARCRLRRAAEVYSPECLEGEFSEVRRHGVLRSWQGNCLKSAASTANRYTLFATKRTQLKECKT